MRFYPLAAAGAEARQSVGEYLTSQRLGRVRLGQERLFFKQGRRLCYIPYAAVGHCVRRVILVPEKLQKNGRAPAWETLVFLDTEGGEVAQVPVPGATALKIVMNELATRLPPGAI